jgi:signal transduction histidine kinase
MAARRKTFDPVADTTPFPPAVSNGTGKPAIDGQSPGHLHAVQFYEEPEALFTSVSRFLSDGLEAGDSLIVIATAAHRDGIMRRLDRHAVTRAIEAEQVILLDAHETLALFMVDDNIDADRFRNTLEALVERHRRGAPDIGIRAFGEMVDVLWRAGNSTAALRLEELWSEASRRHSFQLLCAYGNFFGEQPASSGFAEVCASHTHVLPLDDGPPLSEREISLEQRIRALETELHHRKRLEVALRVALRDRSRVEAELRASIHREREARAKAEENDHFKEQFLGMLGHDLRNPLNTVLTTTRLMVMRAELTTESTKRLERVITSGVRMQRMIEQILDVTCDRLDDGIPVVREPQQDIAAIATAVVEDARVAHPSRRIDLLVDGRCHATVDRERIEQVLKTLIGNALTHGAGDRPVRVMVAALEHRASIEVHNHGSPIDEEDRALLFDPFRRTRKTKGPSEGLGLGLYISKCIVIAHGGRIEVDSSVESGTRFRVTLPRDP